MNPPKDVEFPEFTNPSINVALVADKLNETLAFLREKYPQENVFAAISSPPHTITTQLKEGVRAVDTPRGVRYFVNSKMIKTAEAFV